MPIVLALVAHEQEILSEDRIPPQLRQVVTKIVEKIPRHDTRNSYEYEANIFHCIVENKIVYVAMTGKDDFQMRLVFSFLEDIKSKFKQQFAGSDARYPQAELLSREVCQRFNGTLATSIRTYNENPGAVDKISKVKSQVEEVKMTMMENIDSVIDRGGRIENLVDRTEEMSTQAEGFHKNSKTLRKKMQARNIKIMIAVFGVLILIAFVISLAVCGINYKKCKKSEEPPAITPEPNPTPVPPFTPQPLTPQPWTTPAPGDDTPQPSTPQPGETPQPGTAQPPTFPPTGSPAPGQPNLPTPPPTPQPTPLPPSARTALDDYISAPDPAYNISDLGITYTGIGWTAYIYNLTTQTYLTPEDSSAYLWWHYFVIVVPGNVDKSKTTGYIHITGGHNGPTPPAQDQSDIELAARFAITTRMTCAVLFQVPNQPIVFKDDPFQHQRVEDAAVSFTFWMFMNNPQSNTNWPLLLPMAKAGVKAMDAFQTIAKSRLQHDIDSFYISGASKRGWTTWLVGAVDSRVKAIIPIVLDALNLEAFMTRQFRFYDGWSYALYDYYSVNFTQALGTRPQVLRELGAIIDPYTYRARLTMPKLAVNAVGDQFLMPDDQRYWAHDMSGEMNLLMVKNADHSLATGMPIVMAGIGAFLQANLNDFARPNYTWSIDATTGEITLETDTVPYNVSIAYGFSGNGTGLRDFRYSALNLNPCTPFYGACKRVLPWDTIPATNVTAKKYTAIVPVPATGWVGFFIEARWTNPVGSDDFYFTSPTSVLPFTDPFPACQGEACRGHLV